MSKGTDVMNIPKRLTLAAGRRCFVALAACVLPVLASCGVGTTYFPDEATMAAFEAAGPVDPELDMSQMLAGVPKPGPYRVVAGDVLQLSGVGSFMTGGGGPSTGAVDSIETRVQQDGRISLPMIGDVSVMTPGSGAGEGLVGRTLLEIENLVADTLSDRYLRHRPAIVVRITEYQKVKVAVMGSVSQPGVVELQSDQLSVFGALTAAGGIAAQGSGSNQMQQGRAAVTQTLGAKMIRIKKPGNVGAKPIVLPVKGYNLPVADVPLLGGETIEVEPWNPDLYVVLGLVGGRGVFPYPPGERYNLMQALAFAGGTDPLVYPPYATILRKDAQGKVIAASFGINGEDMAKAMDVIVRPGDIIVVEHSIGSWTRQILWEALDLQVQFFLNPFDSDRN